MHGALFHPEGGLCVWGSCVLLRPQSVTLKIYDGVIYAAE